MKRSQTLGAALVGLVALHEHDRTLRQERRLAGKPTLGDRVPFGLLAVIFEVLTIYGLALIVAALWPWLLSVVVLVVAWNIVRRWRRRRW